jgi:putative phage-type endonuclease
MIEQGTPEWQALRVGKLTASRVADMLATVKTGESMSRKNLRADLIAERLTGNKTDSYSNSAMNWGVETEPQARVAYEVFSYNFVDQVAFVDHPTIANFGCSPDGLVGDDGLIEIKCPYSTAIHLEYIETRKPPSKYMTQMMSQMSVNGRKWCDFVSFDPRLPDGLKLLVVRIERDDEVIAKIEAEAIKFLAEVDAKIVELYKQVQ